MNNNIENKNKKNVFYKSFELFLVLIIVVFVCYQIFADVLVSPPSKNCTIRELAETIPAPKRLAIISDIKQKRLVWIGEKAPLAVRSGPPCYVFDDQGKMIRYCLETGEGWDYDWMASVVYQTKPISLEEAYGWGNLKEK